MGIYSEELMLGVKTKSRDLQAYTREREASLEILWCIMILEFRLENVQINNKYRYICLQMQRKLNNDRNDFIFGL